MASIFALSLFFIIISFCITSITIPVQSDGHETFIIHVSKSDKPRVFATHHHWYSSIIRSVSQHPSKILYTYSRAAVGFSARLTAAQADQLRRIPGVISVLPDEVRHLHTTHTPTFLGLADSFGLWPNSDYADDVIIGVLDTGIWPERPSFSDEGLSPVPSSWKGKCATGPDFPETSCNKKIIGAQMFYKGYEFTHNGLLLLIRRNNFTSKLILQPQDEDRRWNIFWVDLHVDHFPRKDSNMAFHGQLAIVDVDLGHYSEISRRVNWIGRCRSNEKYDSTSAPRFGLS